MPRPSLRPDDLARLARLSRVGLDERELRTLPRNLSEILAHAESITSPRAGESPPEGRAAAGQSFVCREDMVCVWEGLVFANSSFLREGHVVVARVL